MITIYSKPGCGDCIKAKNLMDSKQITYNEVMIGRDILLEQFTQRYPAVRSVPYITNNNEEIGNYAKLVEYVNNNGSRFLSEINLS